MYEHIWLTEESMNILVRKSTSFFGATSRAAKTPTNPIIMISTISYSFSTFSEVATFFENLSSRSIFQSHKGASEGSFPARMKKTSRLLVPSSSPLLPVMVPLWKPIRKHSESSNSDRSNLLGVDLLLFCGRADLWEKQKNRLQASSIDRNLMILNVFE